MKRSVLRVASGLLTLTLAVSLLSGFSGGKAFAAQQDEQSEEETSEAESDDVVDAQTEAQTYSKYYEYCYDETVNKGIYLVPEADGKYPLLFLFHGSGGISGFKNNIVSTMNQWISLGYVDPAVIVIPQIDKIIDKSWGEIDFGDFIREGRMDTILNKIDDGTAAFSSKVSTTETFSAAGYSMGGALALYAGSYYMDRCPNVCGGSPAYPYCSPGSGKRSYVGDSKGVVFTSNPNAHLVMGYGLHSDEAQHQALTDMYLRFYNQNKGDNPNEFQIYNTYSGAHNWETFKREIFYFLYYCKFDEVPSTDIIEQACGTNGLKGTVQISGSAKYGQKLTASVSSGNASSYTYTWKRGDTVVSTSSSYTLTKADIGQKLTCEVKDANGTKVGLLKATTATIEKADGPAAPTDLTGTAPTEKGAKDGSISGVTTAMEYSKSSDFSNKTTCTGTKITGLSAGTYYVRIAATETTKASKAVTVVVPEGPEPAKPDPTDPDPVNPDPTDPQPVDPQPSDPTPVTPDPVKEPTFADFIDRLYRYALQREPEEEGKKFWMDKVMNEGFTGGRCAYGFLVEAPEFLNRDLSNEQFIDTLYQIFFDRAADQGGKEFWLQKFSEGMTRAQMVNGFIDSTEWCNLCATYGIKSGAPNAKAEKASNNAIKFATRLYTECLGREYDADGLEFWALRLTNLESSGYEAALGFFTSDEFKQKEIGDDEFIHRLYRTFMGRDEDAEGFAFWKSHLGVDMTREELVKGFAQSQEFTNICNEYGIDKGI